MRSYTREETIDLVKFYPSRQKQNKSAFCVEDRKRNIKQKFFRTKEQALDYAAEISDNFSLHTSGKGQKLLRHIFDCGQCQSDKNCCYKKVRRKSVQNGELREHSFENSMRDMNFFLNIKIDGKRVGDMTALEFYSNPAQVYEWIVPATQKNRVLKTVKNYWASYTHFNSFCVLAGYADHNIFRDTRPKSGGKENTKSDKIERVQRDVVEQILEQLPTGNSNQLHGYTKCNWRLAAFFAAQTGLRQGEQRALTWSDVDFDLRSVSVDKGIDRYHKINKTKTVKSKRKLRFAPVVVKALQEEYMRQGKPPKEDLIWQCTKGGTLNPSMFIKKLAKAAATAGVPRITWHELRHYYASAQLALKGSTKDGIWKVSNNLGHSNTVTTTATYGHWLNDYEEDPEETAREDQAALSY
jgi:integrase